MGGERNIDRGERNIDIPVERNRINRLTQPSFDRSEPLDSCGENSGDSKGGELRPTDTPGICDLNGSRTPIVIEPPPTDPFGGGPVSPEEQRRRVAIKDAKEEDRLVDLAEKGPYGALFTENEYDKACECGFRTAAYWLRRNEPRKRVKLDVEYDYFKYVVRTVEMKPVWRGPGMNAKIIGWVPENTPLIQPIDRRYRPCR